MAKDYEVDVKVKETKVVMNNSDSIVFCQGTVLLKPPAEHPDSSQTTLLPIPVYYDPKTFKILSESIPADLRSSFKDYIF